MNYNISKYVLTTSDALKIYFVPIAVLPSVLPKSLILMTSVKVHFKGQYFLIAISCTVHSEPYKLKISYQEKSSKISTHLTDNPVFTSF